MSILIGRGFSNGVAAIKANWYILYDSLSFHPNVITDTTKSTRKSNVTQKELHTYRINNTQTREEHNFEILLNLAT